MQRRPVGTPAGLTTTGQTHTMRHLWRWGADL